MALGPETSQMESRRLLDEGCHGLGTQQRGCPDHLQGGTKGHVPGREFLRASLRFHVLGETGWDLASRMAQTDSSQASDFGQVRPNRRDYLRSNGTYHRRVSLEVIRLNG